MTPFSPRLLALLAALATSPAAFAQGPSAAAAAPTPDTPSTTALKSQLLDAVQSELNWRTNYFTLQGQVGKLQADLATAQNKLAAAERPPGTVAGGDSAPPAPAK